MIAVFRTTETNSENKIFLDTFLFNKNYSTSLQSTTSSFLHDDTRFNTNLIFFNNCFDDEDVVRDYSDKFRLSIDVDDTQISSVVNDG